MFNPEKLRQRLKIIVDTFEKNKNAIKNKLNIKTIPAQKITYKPINPKIAKLIKKEWKNAPYDLARKSDDVLRLKRLRVLIALLLALNFLLSLAKPNSLLHMFNIGNIMLVLVIIGFNRIITNKSKNIQSMAIQWLITIDPYYAEADLDQINPETAPWIKSIGFRKMISGYKILK